MPLHLVGVTIDKTRSHYLAETGKLVQLMRGIYVDADNDIERADRALARSRDRARVWSSASFSGLATSSIWLSTARGPGSGLEPSRQQSGMHHAASTDRCRASGRNRVCRLRPMFGTHPGRREWDSHPALRKLPGCAQRQPHLFLDLDNGEEHDPCGDDQHPIGQRHRLGAEDRLQWR